MRATFPLIPIVALAAWISPAGAQTNLLDRWYTAMFDVNRAAIADLLADDAVIKLEDLGVTKTKAEFIAALDEWEEIVKTANLAWQLEEGAVADESSSTVLVCYQFPDKEVMIREVFGFGDGKIASSVQSTASDNCEDF
ncbi:MAG: nuclear transport factor 2 family protein [Hoeflea sp.]|nr:nuclear transport factor 2 family protein [Hoeflea sp.]